MIGVVGASARAAVMTLARAGHACWAVDLFNDRDLKRIAPCARCSFDDFPHAIPALAEQFPPGPVMYTGGMENHPDVIAELAQSRELLGCDAETVKRVRDPFNRPNLPATLPSGSVVPEPHAQARVWLIKSLRSSGGLGVRRAVPGEVVPPGYIAQEYVPGPAMSAVYHDGELLGVTEQLMGVPWLHAREFHYCGTVASSVGWALPTHRSGEFGLSPTALELLVGSAHPTRTKLVGYHGIDFILNGDTPYVLEINPRYPASVEAIEFANHLQCTVGKAVWFAPHDLRFPASGPWDEDLADDFDPWRLPNYADIPEPGEPFPAGQPVLTCFATGRDSAECRDRLQSQAAELDRLFERTP